MKSLNKSVRFRNRQKERAVEHFGGKCQECGYSKCLAALTFHHIDPTTKKWSPSRIMSYRWELVLKELEKCILLCANCHHEHHAGITEFDLQRFPSTNMVVECLGCKIEFVTKNKKQKFCTKQCQTLFLIQKREAKIASNIIKPKKETFGRTDKKTLEDLIFQKIPWTHIGKMYGVSDNAVRKWARRYGIVWKIRTYRG
ncbi:MAG: HNH endonuclease signature motif containing protein [Bacteroidia bacterium]|nr:HNH endonuclease signature motif containing protein [Bacteroidia bacterium]